MIQDTCYKCGDYGRFDLHCLDFKDHKLDYRKGKPFVHLCKKCHLIEHDPVNMK